MVCPICGEDEGEDDGTYPNLVCAQCDERAVNEAGNEPWHGWSPGEKPESDDDVIHMPPNAGENPVFIDGQKCW